MIRFPRTAGLFALAMIAGSIAGCSKSAPEPEAPIAANEASEPPVSPDPEPVVANAPAPEPEPEPANVVAPPPEAPTPEDVQMLDDADATGMTARLPDDEPANQDAVPAEGERR